MFGVTPVGILSRHGTPWFLGGERVFEYARDLLDRGPRIIRAWMEDFDTLENVVSADNAKAIRLLKAWGASVGDETRLIGGVEFVPFRWSAIQG